MSIFTPLKEIFRPPQARETPQAWKIPFGLNAGEWNALKSLVAHPGWTLHHKVLDAAVKLQGERILQTSSTEALHFLRGHVAGLRLAGSLIETHIASEKRYLAEREKTETHASRNRDPRSALFGTPGWRPQRSNGAERS